MSKGDECDLLDVIFLIILGNGDICATWFQVNGDHLSKPIFDGGESFVNYVSNVVVKHPTHSPEKLGIHTLQVRQSDLLFQDHLVETDNKVGIQEAPMENGEAKATADELKVVQVFGIDTRCWVDLKGIVVVGGVLKQTVEWIEHFV